MEQEKNIVLEVPDEAKYFTKISVGDREKVKEWLKKQNSYEYEDVGKKFLEHVKMAVLIINYDFWIATLEPSASNGKIYYAEGEYVATGYSGNIVKMLAEEFAPRRGSRLASLHELFLWYALRIANGFWTLDEVVGYTFPEEDYWEKLETPWRIEKTGTKECGGYRDGQQNTYKIVTYCDRFVLVGGDDGHSGECYPIASVIYNIDPNHIRYGGSGVLVLTK